MSFPVKEAQSGDGRRDVPELHGCIRASDLTRMANTCESPVEPSSVSVGLRQLSASAKMACNQSSQFGYAARYYKVAGGSGERGNPDHSPTASSIGTGRQTAR